MLKLVAIARLCGSNLATNILIIFGFTFVVFELIGQEKISARNRTLELLSQYAQIEIMGARIRSLEFWVKQSTGVLIEQGADLDAIRDLVDAELYAKDNAFLEDLRSIIVQLDFFKLVQQCSITDLCDRELTRDLFYTDAENFLCSYGRLIMRIERQSGVTNLGAGLRGFVGEDHLCG